MKSFKNAAYRYINISGNEAAYTQDIIDDKLPDGYYKYYLVFNSEQAHITDKTDSSYTGTVISKNPLDISKDKRITDSVEFDDNEFSFEDFFKGFHRPIDYQIKAAEDKRDAQFQDKAHTKDINLGRDDL